MSKKSKADEELDRAGEALEKSFNESKKLWKAEERKNKIIVVLMLLFIIACCVFSFLSL